jgi:hypothetical protein
MKKISVIVVLKGPYFSLHLNNVCITEHEQVSIPHAAGGGGRRSQLVAEPTELQGPQQSTTGHKRNQQNIRRRVCNVGPRWSKIGHDDTHDYVTRLVKLAAVKLHAH